MKRIEFNKVDFHGNELDNIKRAVQENKIAGDGIFTKKCNAFIEKSLNVEKSFMTTSCTHALEMTALLLDIQPGDEVIIPSFTFVSTANAFTLRGAIPIFADIRADTLNIDEQKIEPLITKKTKVIVVVHYAGIGCEMVKIMELANKYNIDVVEDNAHGFLGKYDSNYLGSFGTFSTLSFHETKNFTCGEGGSLVINNTKYIERAEIIREKGTDRTKFVRGEIDKYSWVDIGSSFLPSEILSAFLYAQFEQKEQIQATRKRIWNYYNDSLKDWAYDNDIKLPTIPDNCVQTHHIFYLVLKSNKTRDSLIKHLRQRGIPATFHFLPLHLSKKILEMGLNNNPCSVAEQISARLLRLPIHNSLQPDQINIDHFYDFKS
tara:strand:- start:372 stop:1499 length:1128 start_codon:yes stop_codon:yes gene_type:complete